MVGDARAGDPVVVVPSQAMRASLPALPPAVRVEVWDGAGAGSAPVDAQFLATRAVLTSDQLDGLAQLEVLQLLTAGYDRWAGRVPQGVQVCNARGVHGRSTAELAVAGMLAILRQLPRAVQRQTDHVWRLEETDCLDGKRVTIVGAGDVARYVAAAIAVFGAKPVLVGRTARDGVCAMEELPALLGESDIVVLALPATPQTTGMVDAEFLARMPDGAMLVNVARGGLVRTEALVDELSRRRIWAFLDVVAPEPLPPESPLWDAPQLLMTSHIGGGAARWEQRAARLIGEQVLAWLVGDALVNRIDDPSLRRP